MDIGQRIKDIRTSKNMTQDEFANLIHKTTATVKKYEAGQITLTIDTILDIAKALDVSVSYILNETSADLFCMFLEQYNLKDLSKKELLELEIEFKFILDFLSYKHSDDR